jgi:hypothetical protein
MMEGQITLTDFLSKQIIERQIDGFTEFLNKQGESQYKQIGKVVVDTYEKNKGVSEKDLLERITNNVSVYVLEQSMKYDRYLREQATQ